VQNQNLQTIQNPFPTRQKWTPQRDDQLWSLKEARVPRRAMCSILKETEDAIGSRLRELNRTRISEQRGWTDERVDLLKKWWADGLSASQIATKLGECTRNAVIGKVSRLGLAGRTTTQRKTRPPRPQSRVVWAFPIQKPPKKAPAKPNYSGIPNSCASLPPHMLAIAGLQANHCRYPIGDPLQEGFGFCCHPRTHGAYCAAHGKLCYQTIVQRVRK
jgi:GcrA cell cycle regulator